jgi:hypothetical protein
VHRCPHGGTRRLLPQAFGAGLKWTTGYLTRVREV